MNIQVTETEISINITKSKLIEYAIYGTIVLLSLWMFIFFVIQNGPITKFDESWYLEISGSVKKLGLFSIEEPVRTYLFPLLIAIFTTLFSDGTPVVPKVFFSIMQFVVFFFTVRLIAVTAYRMINHKVAFYGIMFLGLLNPYLVQATTLYLSDILPSCLVSIAFIYLVFYPWDKWKHAFLIPAFLYASVMIRPSSAIFLIVYAGIFLFKWFVKKDVNPTKLAIGSTFMLIIFVPQLYMNITKFNDFTPLLHQGLYASQTQYAAKYLKYGTVFAPNEGPQLFYTSPFDIANGTSMFGLIFTHPIQFAVTYFGHIFGVIDWGYVDNYIRDLHSKSRILPTILLYLQWFVIVLGIIKSKTMNKVERYALLAPSVIYLLFIGTTCVESRFGYPAYMLSLLFAGYGMVYIANNLKNKKIIFKLGSIFFVVCILSLYVSYLIDMQANRIIWF